MRRLFTAAVILVSAQIGSASAAPSEMIAAEAFARQAYFNTQKDMRPFRRCMRATYGPRYYRGVRQQYRLAMAQACM
jgi:hypothetical protein